MFFFLQSTLFCADQKLAPKLQAMFLVADDMMDASITRRGSPCWYRMVSLFHTVF
jgi:hypothetical protein